VIPHGKWKRIMSTQTNNKRELVAINMDLREFTHLFKEKGCITVQMRSDNSATVYNINRGAALKTLALSFWKLLLYAQYQGFTLQGLYIPGVKNKTTDFVV
jgi:hypothetical protein